MDKRWVKNAARIFELARRFLTTYKIQTIAALILLLMTVNLVSVTLAKMFTGAEVVLTPPASYHLVTSDLQLIREHPPLSELQAGLPLLFIQPNELPPPNFDPSVTRAEREWTDAIRFRTATALGFKQSLSGRAPIGFTLTLGVLIFYFTRDLFGPRAAGFTVFALEPTHVKLSSEIESTFTACILNSMNGGEKRVADASHCFSPYL